MLPASGAELDEPVHPSALEGGEVDQYFDVLLLTFKYDWQPIICIYVAAGQACGTSLLITAISV